MMQMWKRYLGKNTLMAATMLLLTVQLGYSQEERAAPEVALRLEDAFTNVAESSFPAIVVITNKQVPRMRGGGMMYPNLPPELRRFFGLPDPEEREGQQPESRQIPQPMGKGSGFFFHEDGYIITNYHVIKDHDALEVELSDGRIFDTGRDENAVTVVGTDEETDLAVLQVGNGELSGMPILEFADSEEVRVGEWAIAVGAPFNLDYSITVGVVSQKGRHDVGVSTYENYIQTDASINPGNSGGPLMNIRSKVIGINNFIIAGGGMSRGSIGLGFAVSSNLARQVAEGLIEHGEVIRPFLGIGMQETTEELRDQFEVEFGVLIREVMEGDPADQAGVQAGDVVQKVGDKVVRTPHDLLFAVLAYAPGETIKLTVVRNGETQVIDVVARKRGDLADEDGPATQEGEEMLNQLGLSLEQGEESVIVANVIGGSPADASGVRRGDLILEVNRLPVASIGDVVAALGRSRRGIAIFYIERRGSRMFVPIPVAGKQ